MSNLNAAHLYSAEGMVAVITGGATGIGLMMTKTLAANGAKAIYVVGRRKEKLDEAAASVEPKGVVIPLVADVTSKSDLSKIAATVASQTGFINVLICNSGTIGPNIPALPSDVSVEEYSKLAMDSDKDSFNTAMDTNVASVLWSAYAFLPLLAKGNTSGVLNDEIKSQIIVTSSIASYSRVPAAGMAYKASKAAASHIAVNMSSTFSPYDIRCNAICPGLFQSDLAQGLISKGHTDTSKQSHEEGAFDKANIPLRRVGREAEMGGTVLYLVSRAGGYNNGTLLVMDGGRLNVMRSV